MIKQWLLSICLTSFSLTTVTAQSYTSVYYLDNNLTSTTQGNAFFIGKGIPDSGLFRVDYFYQADGKPLMSIHFTDSSLSNMTGFFRSFYENGKKENEGWYKNNVENGVWFKWDSSGFKKDSSVYVNGKVTAKALYRYDETGKLATCIFEDSLTKKEKYSFYKAGVITYEVEYAGTDDGILKIYENDSVKTIAVSKKDRVEASFPGGDQGYRSYLVKNLDSDLPVSLGVRDGTYKVIVSFIVNTDGSISNVVAETNFGFGMEAAAVKLIKNCPRWKPAMISGYPVPCFRRQPITFFYKNE
ncbi:MAG: energy transducer TonB [Ferruginibacter sp.]